MAVPPLSPASAEKQPGPDPMVKPALRSAIRARRADFVASLDDETRARHAAAMAQRLEPAFRRAACVGAYAPLTTEFPILPALHRAAAMGVATALPHVTHRDVPMVFRAWQPGSLLDKGYFGLSQPEKGALAIPDLILAPLLGFDRHLRRLGQGAGFYDRWLADHPGTRCIGIAWSVQEQSEIPVDAWDMPLHAIATENEWIGPML